MIQRRDTRGDGAAETQPATQRFWVRRDAVRQIVARHTAGTALILGTMARPSAARSNGRVSVVVALPPGHALTNAASLEEQLSAACGLRVDVVTLDALRASVRADLCRSPLAAPQDEPGAAR